MPIPDTLRRLFERPEIVVAPGAYDGLTARLVEQAGFPAVYMTGAGTAADALAADDAEGCGRLRDGVTMGMLALL